MWFYLFHVLVLTFNAVSTFNVFGRIDIKNLNEKVKENLFEGL